MTTEGARTKPAFIKGPTIVDRLRLWVRTKPALLDRLKPLARALGYATPLQRVLRAHLRQADAFRAVQIGAHDGVTHDPFREHLIRPGWESLVLEPNPVVFATLVKNYRAHPRVQPVNAAVGYSGGSLSLWMFDPDYLARRPDAAVLSTLVSHSRELMLRNLAPGDEAAAHLREVRVPCATIESLLDQRGWPRLDALFVDVEGFENDILLNMDCPRLDAKLIVFEHHLLADQGAAITRRLAQQGYECTRIGCDTLAVRRAAWRRAQVTRIK